MRFAVIADIHGNALALEAVLADIDRLGVAEILNLGDHLAGPLEAARTADILIDRPMISVAGNHDRYLLTQDPAAMHEWESDCYHALDERHLDWLESLPFSRVWKDEVFLCHATPHDDNVYWLETVSPAGIAHFRPQDEIEAFAEGVTQSLILCGHSHLPRTAQISGRRMIVNPGSVGCPAYDDDLPFPHKMETGTPAASYALIEKHGPEWDVTFRLIPYAHHAAAAMALAKGRPLWAQALETGRV